jgi:hypothetical protein
VSAEGAPGNNRSGSPHLSPNGYRLAYTSAASNFASPDHGGFYDVFLTTVHPFQAVDDGDGMADHWELEHFGHLEVPPHDDADLDGFDNLDEFIAGTDPQNRAAHPRLELVRDTAGSALRWTAVPGRVYTIESRPDGVTGVWSRGAGIIRVGGNSAVYKPTPAEAAPCYFRLQIVNESGP